MLSFFFLVKVKRFKTAHFRCFISYFIIRFIHVVACTVNKTQMIAPFLLLTWTQIIEMKSSTCCIHCIGDIIFAVEDILFNNNRHSMLLNDAIFRNLIHVVSMTRTWARQREADKNDSYMRDKGKFRISFPVIWETRQILMHLLASLLNRFTPLLH